MNLVKAVRQEMRDLNTLNKGKKSVWDAYSSGFDVLQGFDYLTFSEKQSFPVYSAPGKTSWRGAGGKASVSTGGAVYAAGVESGWLMVMYETNNKGVRVGYIDCSAVKGKVQGDAWQRNLYFSYLPAQVLEGCSLTDDPAAQNAVVTALRAGDSVTYLSTFYNNRAWDYVETTVNGQKTRGFIPGGNLNYGLNETDDIGAGAGG